MEAQLLSRLLELCTRRVEAVAVVVAAAQDRTESSQVVAVVKVPLLLALEALLLRTPRSGARQTALLITRLTGRLFFPALEVSRTEPAAAQQTASAVMAVGAAGVVASP